MKKYLCLFLIIIMTQCGTPKRKTSSYIGNLVGSGSSFTLPLTDQLFKSFSKLSNIKINYTSKNSYEGINELLNGNIDFAISTVPLTDNQIKDNPDILHIPIAAAGINFAYNIPMNGFSLSDDPVYLTPEILVKIFNKQITKWNDPEIVALNKMVSESPERIFPNLSIITIQRSEPSGDTYLFTKFLNKATANWKLGATNLLPIYNNNNIQQPSSLDLMIKLSQNPGAITYTTMIYGVQNNIPLARIKNYLGTYGRGCNFRSLEAMKVTENSSDNRIDLTYPTKGKEAGVATALVYILVKKEQNYNNRTQEQAQNTVDFINWLLSPVAQKQFEPLFFANLTPKFRIAAHETLAQLTYNDTPLIPSNINKKN